MSRAVCVVVLLVLAALHSLLGELRLLRPLFSGPLPRGALPLGRAFTERTLRFAWHLLSLAWVALAAIALGATDAELAIVGALLAGSAVVALVASRGRHFAWALFAVGGAAGLLGPHVARAEPVAGGIAAALLAAIAALHVGWMFGVRWGRRVAIPEVEGRPAFVPAPGITALAAVAFLGAGAVVLAAPRSDARVWAWLCLAGASVFALRAMGDFRLVGLTKRVHGTPFSRWDDRLFTPLCVLLAVCFTVVGARGLS